MAAFLDMLLDRGTNAHLEYLEPREEYYGQKTEPMSIIQLAVKAGKVSLVKTLLAKGADPMAGVTKEQQHPLINAASQGATEVGEALLSSGVPVDVNGRGPRYKKNNASPLHAAVFEGHLDIIKLLLSFGADVELNVDGSDTPLSLAASTGKHRGGTHVDIGRCQDRRQCRFTRSCLGQSFPSGQTIAVCRSHTADGVIALACQVGNLSIIDSLINNALQHTSAETIFDEAYAAKGLKEPVTRLLLEYGVPTMPQFRLARATASAASVQLLLRQPGINIDHETGSADQPS